MTKIEDDRPWVRRVLRAGQEVTAELIRNLDDLSAVVTITAPTVVLHRRYEILPPPDNRRRRRRACRVEPFVSIRRPELVRCSKPLFK